MKRTLLEFVQSILSDMDSEHVNSIDESLEAQQIASVIETTFYNIISARDIPEHKQTVPLISLSDSSRPTHFKYPVNTVNIISIMYNVHTSGGLTYKEVKFIEPEDFLRMQPSSDAGSTLVVPDVGSTTSLVVFSNRMPSYYTSFDDEYIVMDSYDISQEATLVSAKTRAFGTVYPTFTISDAFEPDLDDTMLPYLLAESKSACFSLFKSGSDPKVEQSARRLKSYVQNDMYRTKRGNKRVDYWR